MSNEELSEFYEFRERQIKIADTFALEIRHPDTYAFLQTTSFFGVGFQNKKEYKDPFRDHIFYYIDQMIEIVKQDKEPEKVLLGKFEYKRLEKYFRKPTFDKIINSYIPGGNIKKLDLVYYKEIPVHKSKEQFLVDVI